MLGRGWEKQTTAAEKASRYLRTEVSVRQRTNPIGTARVLGAMIRTGNCSRLGQQYQMWDRVQCTHYSPRRLLSAGSRQQRTLASHVNGVAGFPAPPRTLRVITDARVVGACGVGEGHAAALIND